MAKKGYRTEWEDGRWIAHIKVGPKWTKRSNKWRTKDVADVAAKELHESLNAAYSLSNPVPAEPSAPAKTPPGKSLREIFLAKVERHIRRRRLKNPTPVRRGAHYIIEGLKAYADLGLKEQKPWQWSKCRDWLIDKSGLSANTLETYVKLGREVLLRHVVQHGLDPACIDEIKRLPITALSTNEASGLPFSKSNLETIFDVEATQSDTTKLVIWLGASGGLQIGDIVFFELAFVDWETGMIHGKRVKTKAIYEFKALPPLMELLRKRRAELGEGAVYVLPELIFSRSERQESKCNTMRWTDVPSDYQDNGTVCGIQVVTAFLELCGIKSADLTNKSWRKLLISVWASIGLREKVRMRMAGHRDLDEHLRYDTPAHFEIARTADVVWRMFCAIRERKPFFIPTTVFDVYDALHAEMTKLPELFRKVLVEEHAALHKKLDAALADNQELGRKMVHIQIQNQELSHKIDRVLDMLDRDVCLTGVPELV